MVYMYVLPKETSSLVRQLKTSFDNDVDIPDKSPKFS